MDFFTRVYRGLYLQPLAADGVIAVDLAEWENEPGSLPGVAHLDHTEQLPTWVRQNGWHFDMTSDGKTMVITRPAEKVRRKQRTIRSARPLIMPPEYEA